MTTRNSDWIHINQRAEFHGVYMPRNEDLRPSKDGYWLHIMRFNRTDPEWLLRYGSTWPWNRATETVLGKFKTLKAAKLAYRMIPKNG